MLTQAEALRLFDYDPDTGIVTRKIHTSTRARAGDIPGYIHEGYIRIGVSGHEYMIHRIVWLMVHGKFPKDCLDHINGVRDDNRMTNLREATKQTNNKNRKRSSNNTSGVTGVYQLPSGNWGSTITSRGNQQYLGTYQTFEAAVKVRKMAEKKFKFHPNHDRVEV